MRDVNDLASDRAEPDEALPDETPTTPDAPATPNAPSTTTE
jgi:hypothetical protein